jgi:hypothetical protein
VVASAVPTGVGRPVHVRRQKGRRHLEYELYDVAAGAIKLRKIKHMFVLNKIYKLFRAGNNVSSEHDFMLGYNPTSHADDSAREVAVGGRFVGHFNVEFHVERVNKVGAEAAGEIFFANSLADRLVVDVEGYLNIVLTGDIGDLFGSRGQRLLSGTCCLC